MNKLYESDLEEACLRWFADLGYEVIESDNLEPESGYGERETYNEVILEGRLRQALEHLNRDAPIEAIDEAIRRIKRADAPTLVQNNFDFHRMWTDGVEVEVARKDGTIGGVRIRLFEAESPEENNFVVTNQVKVVDRAGGNGQTRIPDLVVWVNGLPLAVIELKNPTDEDADVWHAYQQLQNYKREIPSLFHTNQVLVASDDVLSRVGSLTAGEDRFVPWRAVENEKDMRVPSEKDEVLDSGERLQALIEGIFEKDRFLDLVTNFVTFTEAQGKLIKKLAAYHQFHAVRETMKQTLRASSPEGDKRIGVVWHTQGSGKSLTMLFYAGKLVSHPQLQNPTVVVLTDRNDLDEQLFSTFSGSEVLLRQTPVRAEGREHLRELLRTTSGGVYFTTVQKFLPPDGEPAPPLSERRNIIVLADEAHRSQYGFEAKVNTSTGALGYGFAKHMRDAVPNASFVGFTGTPIELADKSTIAVFGEYISVYDIQRAVEDGATIPVYYENRLAKIELDEDARPLLDAQFEEVTEGEEDTVKEGLKTHWSSLEKVVGADKRVALVAEDLLAHFDKRNEAMEGGKALIVCMSRRICAAMYEQIVRLRPEWHSDDDDDGKIKVVMTGSSSDVPEIAKHARSKTRRQFLAERFKDPEDQLNIVIVRDMWLTGFDAPCMHTLYVDKPMQGHNLMQAITRVNRVFGDKPGGLVVDYIGLGTHLKDAMATYTRSGGHGDAASQQEQAIDIMLEKLEVCRDLFHGFDYTPFFGEDASVRLSLLPAAREHILKQRTGSTGKGKTKQLDGYEKYLKTVTELTKASAIVSSTTAYDENKLEIVFFQAVKAGLVKLSPGRKRPMSDLGHAVRQIVANAVISEEVIDIYSAAGIERPDISILSEEFLLEVQGMEHKNLAAAILERILRDKIRAKKRTSLVQARSFEELLEQAIQRYLNRSIETTEVIQQLLELARKFREDEKRAEALGLTREEVAFYDALAENESARDVLGDKVLAAMAHELTGLVRKNATIDWTQKRSVQAKLRSLVKRLLGKYDYPPDGQKRATENVLDQAKQLGINVTAGLPEEQHGDSIAPSEHPAGAGAEGSIAPSAEMPFPIAVFDSLVASQTTGSLRVVTRIDGIERAIAFTASCALAWLIDDNGGSPSPEVLKVFGDDLGKPISMGTWLRYAVALAKLLPKDSDDPVVLAARCFVDDRNKPSKIARELEADVVPQRNVFGHGVKASEQQVIVHEKPMNDAWKRLLVGLKPLRSVRMVSRDKMLDAHDDGTYSYQVRLHMGDAERFRVEDVRVTNKLAEPWAYLVRPDESALSLRPAVFLHYVPETGKHEVFLARTLGFESGTKIDAMGLISTSKTKIKL